MIAFKTVFQNIVVFQKPKIIKTSSNFQNLRFVTFFIKVMQKCKFKVAKNDGYLMCKTEVHRHFLQFLCILVYESSTEKPHHNTFLQDKIHARRV